jgi:urease gamma subunit
MDGFLTIYNDLKKDLILTFPELTDTLNQLGDDTVYEYCLSVFPNHFFDILYEKMSLFDDTVYLLPNIDFSLLMKDEKLSDKSRNTLWKYLQLILFYVVEKNNPMENSAHEKMEETMEHMKNMFQQNDLSNTIHSMFGDLSNNPMFGDLSNNPMFGDLSNNPMFGDLSNNPMFGDLSNNPMFGDLSNNPMDKMMNGKIGEIAKEIAQETANDFGNPEDFMNSIMKDPSKMMGLVKNVGSKLEGKLKNSDLKEEDMMKEASDIMNQMKDMPGLKDMMKNIDMKGMMNKMEQVQKQNDTKERMRKKMQKNMEQRELEKTSTGDYVFQKGDAPKKTKRKQKKK